MTEQNIDKEIVVPVSEVTNAQQQNYVPSLLEAVGRGCSDHAGTFYVEVLLKQDEENYKQYKYSFKIQKLCPYPNYDQSVFRYNRDKEQIEFVWTLPDQDTARHLIKHRTEVVEEEKELLNFVVAFGVGKLRELCEKWNKAEQEKEPEKIIEH